MMSLPVIVNTCGRSDPVGAAGVTPVIVAAIGAAGLTLNDMLFEATPAAPFWTLTAYVPATVGVNDPTSCVEDFAVSAAFSIAIVDGGSLTGVTLIDTRASGALKSTPEMVSTTVCPTAGALGLGVSAVSAGTDGSTVKVLSADFAPFGPATSTVQLCGAVVMPNV